jgi:predicted RecA/RadA family phage recombinase
MATNYIAEGKVINHTAGSNIVSGQVVVIGTNRIGIALTDIANGTVGPVQVEGVFQLPKLSTDAPAQYALLYWDAGNTRLTTTSSTHALAGRAYRAQVNGDTTAQVILGVS